MTRGDRDAGLPGDPNTATANVGTYYSETPAEGFDPAGPNDSQGYITEIATRAMIFIEADNPAIGLRCVLPVGMAEVSTCEITVYEGQHVKKGSQLGMFHFGGSTHCLLFRPGVNLEFDLHGQQAGAQVQQHPGQLSDRQSGPMMPAVQTGPGADQPYGRARSRTDHQLGRDAVAHAGDKIRRPYRRYSRLRRIWLWEAIPRLSCRPGKAGAGCPVEVEPAVKPRGVSSAVSRRR